MTSRRWKRIIASLNTSLCFMHTSHCILISNSHRCPSCVTRSHWYRLIFCFTQNAEVEATVQRFAANQAITSVHSNHPNQNYGRPRAFIKNKIDLSDSTALFGYRLDGEFTLFQCALLKGPACRLLRETLGAAVIGASFDQLNHRGGKSAPSSKGTLYG